jgi:hypothetical protein
MRRLLLLGFLLLVTSPSAAVERNFHGGAVSIELPDAWRKQVDEQRGSGYVLMYEVPFAATDPTPHIAQFVLTSSNNSSTLSVADYAHQVLRDELTRPGFVILAASADSTSSLTVLSTGGDKGARYAVIDRFSSSAEWLARVRIAFPLLKQAPRSWYDSAIPDFNSVLASFNKCGSSNSGVSQLRLSGGILGLVPIREGAFVRAIDDPVLKSPFPEAQQGLVIYTESPPPISPP